MVLVAAFQAIPAKTFKERKEQIASIFKKADANNIQFLLFPEGFLTGYYEDQEKAFANALEVSSHEFQNWLSEIEHFQTTAIIGFTEKEGKDLFDSAAIVEKGKLLGVQRKHYLYHNYFTQGSTFSVFQSKGVLFGVTICLDSNYFDPARLLALQGAQILFSPMCNKVSPDHPFAKRPPYYSHLIARAHENRCWVVTADWVWPNDGALVSPGHSVVYDPDGREILRSHEGEEDFLLIDIPHDRLFQEKGRRVYGSHILAEQIRGFG